MIQLELVGCTGAGKSTLATRIVESAFAQGVDLIVGDQCALSRLGLRKLNSKPLRALGVHAVAGWECLVKHRQHRQFIQFASRMLAQTGIPKSQQMNQLRKILKQLGRYNVIQRSLSTPEKFALVDEGTLHAAHNLFVHVGHAASEDQLDEFARLVPLPDLVIYLREHEEVLVNRTIQRGHPRIAIPTPETVSGFVRQAVRVFDQLSNLPKIAARMIQIQDGAMITRPPRLSQPPMEKLVNVLNAALEASITDARSQGINSTSVVPLPSIAESHKETVDA